MRPIFIAGRLEKKGTNIIITLNIFNIKGVDTLARRSEIFKPEYEDELIKNWIFKQPYNLDKYFKKIDCPYILGEDGLVNENIKSSPCYSTSTGSYDIDFLLYLFIDLSFSYFSIHRFNDVLLHPNILQILSIETLFVK